MLYRHYIDLGSLTVLPETFAFMFTVFREFQSFYVLNSRRYFFNPINILKHSLVCVRYIRQTPEHMIWRVIFSLVLVQLALRLTGQLIFGAPPSGRILQLTVS